MAVHSSTLAWKIPWMEEPGRLQSMGSERLHFHFSLSCIGEGNGNPLQCSCLENPRDGGAWWAAVYGVTQNRTQLKRFSSSSSSSLINRSNPSLLMLVPHWEPVIYHYNHSLATYSALLSSSPLVFHLGKSQSWLNPTISLIYASLHKAEWYWGKTQNCTVRSKFENHNQSYMEIITRESKKVSKQPKHTFRIHSLTYLPKWSFNIFSP